MNTVLTEEQTLFRDSILKVLSQSHPIGRPMGKPEIQRQADAALWPQAADLGWLRFAMPERLDGLGGTRSDLAIIAEAFGRHLVISPFAAVLGFGACALAHANAADATLRDIGEGKLAALPLLTGTIGRDWPEVLISRQAGAQKLTVDGRFRAVPYGASAESLLVAARATPDHAPELYLIRRDTPGVSLKGYRLMDGSEAADADLQGVALTSDARIPGTGTFALGLDTAAALAAAELSGAMWTLHQMTLDYLKTRRQFGVVLSTLQVLQHRLVDMYVLCQTAEAAMLEAVSAIEGEDANTRALRVSRGCAHVFAAARKVGEEAIQLHGGIAMTADYAVGSYVKRITVLRTQYGDERWHRARVRDLTRAGIVA
ncbi:MAG: acyl-CoA dehydrogenase family protein [Hyphomicrobiaceae bacterium]